MISLRKMQLVRFVAAISSFFIYCFYSFQSFNSINEDSYWSLTSLILELPFVFVLYIYMVSRVASMIWSTNLSFLSLEILFFMKIFFYHDYHNQVSAQSSNHHVLPYLLDDIFNTHSSPSIPALPRRSFWPHQPLVYLQNYCCNKVSNSISAYYPPLSKDPGKPYSISYSNISSAHKSYILTLLNNAKPSSFTQVIKFFSLERGHGN